IQLRHVKFIILFAAAAALLAPTPGLTQMGAPPAAGGPGAFPPGGFRPGGAPGGFPQGGMPGGFPQGGGPPGFPGGGGGGGWGGMGGGGMGGGSRDPNDRWNQYTGGKPVWVRAEITDPNMQQRFDFIARMVGSTNGVITKDQYLAMAQARAAGMTGGAP